MKQIGGVVVMPRADPGVLIVALIATGEAAENMVGSWEIGDGRSVALLSAEEVPASSGPTLRLLA